MIVTTLDTNVLASGALATDSAVAHVMSAWFQGELVVVLSSYILGELDNTLKKPYFARRLRAETTARYVALMRDFARIVPIMEPLPRVAAHPEDDPVLATAIRGNVDFLVTGDRRLRALGSFQGVSIVSAQSFVRILAEQSTE